MRVLLLLLLLFHPAVAREGYLNLQRGPSGKPAALKTQIARFVSSKGQKVDLVAVVHVGERSYYEKLNKHFGNYQSVLYEMVLDVPKSVSHQNDVRVLLGHDKIEPKIDTKRGGRDTLSLFQKKLADTLGLEFQLDRINYDRGNFHHADLTLQEFQDAMADKKSTPFDLLKSLFDSQQADLPPEYKKIATLPILTILTQGPTPRQRSILRVGVAALLSQEGDVTSQAEGEVLIGKRNERAIEVLQERLGKGETAIAIFYGAAHMPDLSKRLRALGFKPVSQSWVTAWDL